MEMGYQQINATNKQHTFMKILEYSTFSFTKNYQTEELSLFPVRLKNFLRAMSVRHGENNTLQIPDN